MPTRYRKRRPAGAASHTYQGEVFELAASVVGGWVGVVAGIVALVLGAIQGLILLGGLLLDRGHRDLDPHRHDRVQGQGNKRLRIEVVGP
jgi:hypothetical protein